MRRSVFQSRSRTTYECLPMHFLHAPIRRTVHARRPLLFCILFLACVVIYLGPSEVRRIVMEAWFAVRYSEHPPTFDQFYEIERQYVQNNASLPFPEGESGRFLWVSNPLHSVGWNNALEVLIMISQVAYLSNRALVLEPYTWNRGPERFSIFNGNLIPSRIPLAALIDGPIGGVSFPPDQPNPRFISVDFFKQVCPKNRRARVSIKEMNKGLSWSPSETLDKYSSKLLDMTESCVELYGGKEHPFDWMHFGDARMESVVPSLSRSPILREFKWSKLVLSALRTNAPDVAPELARDPLPPFVPDLMAIHVRQGDFDKHCRHVARWNSTYKGWAQAPGLPDRFVPPFGGRVGRNTPENTAEYMRHCFPNIPEIVARVEDVRRDWETRAGRPGSEPRLRRLYIMTNGKNDWVNRLKKQLLATGDWAVVLSSRDMYLTSEQKFIGQAIDAAIAERAAVFLGNGFSSLTANTVLIRRVRNLPLISNRFW